MLSSKHYLLYNKRMKSIIKLKKRGIAPYMSWVLLMGLIIILSLFMFSWITTQVDTSISYIEKGSDNSLCEKLSLSINDACQNTQTLNMNVTNVNTLEIDQLRFRFFDLYDNPEFRTLNITIRPRDIESIKVLKQGTLKQAEIIPVIIKDKKIIVCNDKIVTLENINIC